MIDQATIALILQGLNLVDRFTNLTTKLFGGERRPSSTEARRGAAGVEIVRDGKVAESIPNDRLDASSWDDLRYRSLKRRIDANWFIYNEIDAELPVVSPAERAQLKLRLARIRDELCRDFREFVRLAEGILGTHLGDHYSLNEICGLYREETGETS